MALASRNITSAKRKFKSRPRRSEPDIIIPAAGMGYRMKSYGAKALINIYDDTCIIERQIELLWSVYPKSEIFITIGFEAEKIKKRLENYPIRFIHNPIHETTNVLCSLGLAAEATLSQEIIIVYGDLIFNENTIKNLKGSSKIVVDKGSSFLRKSEVGVIVGENGVTNFSFGLDDKWAQIACLTGKELDIFKQISTKEQTRQWFGYEALNYIIENGGKIDYVTPKSMKIFEIDTPKDLEKIPKNKLTFG
tara:strand:- start:4480 stop:5229 length:750 start_codon:yes stop_codon:yes gene_type:complete